MDKNLKDQEKDQDVLLVKEKGKDKLQAAQMDKDGKVSNADLDKGANPDFIKIDKGGNALMNFFENFMRQVKNPTAFDFFRVSALNPQEEAKKLEKALKNPEKPENKEYFVMLRVNPEDWQKLQGQEKGREQSQTSPKSPNYNAIHEDNVNWGQLDSIGVSRENLVKTNNLQKLLNWQKTDLLPIYVKNGDNVFVRTDARLSLRESTDGNLNLSVHALRKEPELERPYFGVKFTDDDKKNFLTTGNLGRIANAEYNQGEKTPVYLSIDRQTNEGEILF